MWELSRLVIAGLSLLPNCWFNSFFLFVLMFVKCHPLLVEGNPYDSPKYSRDSIKGNNAGTPETLISRSGCSDEMLYNLGIHLC